MHRPPGITGRSQGNEPCLHRARRMHVMVRNWGVFETPGHTFSELRLSVARYGNGSQRKWRRGIHVDGFQATAMD